MNPLEELKKKFSEITRLNHIRNLLGWDEQVNLPNGSFGGRAEQSALLSKIVHERLISDKIGNLIKESEKLDHLNLIDAATLREAKRDYEQEVKLPTELVEEISKTSSLISIINFCFYIFACLLCFYFNTIIIFFILAFHGFFYSRKFFY